MFIVFTSSSTNQSYFIFNLKTGEYYQKHAHDCGQMKMYYIINSQFYLQLTTVAAN